MPLNAEQRRTRAIIAAHTRYAKGPADTRPALAGFAKKFLDEVDPERVLPEAERLRRASHARAAHYARFSAAGVAARKAKAGADKGQAHP